MTIRSTRTDALVAVLIAVPLVVVMLLWLYYPTVPRSILGWALLFIIGIPTWYLFEWIWERVFESKVFSRLGSAARIALAVPVLILFLFFGAYIIRLGQRAIGGS